MPITQPQNSSKVNTLGFHAVFDLVANLLRIDLGPTVWIGTGGSNVLGAKLIVTSPSGVLMANGSSYVFVPPMLQTVTLDLPLFNGVPEWGPYQFRIILDEAAGIYDQIDDSYDLCAPYDPLHAKGLIQMRIVADCIKNTLLIYGPGGATYNQVSPSTWSNTYTYFYPAGSNKADQPVINFPVQLALYTGTSKIQGYSIGLFKLPKNYDVLIQFNGAVEKNVSCSYPCYLFCAYKQLVYDTENCEYGSKLYVRNYEKLESVERYLGIVNMAFQCGEDASDEVDILNKLLGCECSNCDEGSILDINFNYTSTTTTLAPVTTSTVAPTTTTTTVAGSSTTQAPTTTIAGQTTTTQAPTTTTTTACPVAINIEMSFGVIVQTTTAGLGAAGFPYPIPVKLS